MPRPHKAYTMLYLHMTLKLAKERGVLLTLAPKLKDVPWLDCWYMNVIGLDLPFNALVFTNASTKFSLVHPYDPREPLEDILSLFHERLKFITGRDQKQHHPDYQTCQWRTGNVLSYMNMIIHSVITKAELQQRRGDGVDFDEIEGYLNDGGIDETCPKDEFFKKLKDIKPVLRETKVPHLKIVE